jgi:hypothetical protein
MGVLDSLSSFASQAKNITLPGVVAATAFAILAWPPTPLDRITIQSERTLNIDAPLYWPLLAPLPPNDLRYPFAVEGFPACSEGRPVRLFQDGKTIRQIGEDAKKNQRLLEDAHQSYLRCIEAETVLNGEDDALISYTTNLLTQRAAERASILDKFQSYSLQLSPVSGEFKKQLDDKDVEIRDLQIASLRYQQVKGQRGYRVDELNRLDKEVQARLAEPGRLRPKQQFDDILNGLSNHVLGFLTLVLAWSFLLDPINRALFSYVYDERFDGMWDRVRADRVPDPVLQAVRADTKPDQPGPNFAAIKLVVVVIIAAILCLLPSDRDGSAEKTAQAASDPVFSASSPQTPGQKQLVCNSETCIPAPLAQCSPDQQCLSPTPSSAKTPTSDPSKRSPQPSPMPKSQVEKSKIPVWFSEVEPVFSPPPQFAPGVDVPEPDKGMHHESFLFLRCCITALCAWFIAYYLPKVIVDLREIRRDSSEQNTEPQEPLGQPPATDKSIGDRDKLPHVSRLQPEPSTRTRRSGFSVIPELLFYKTPSRAERIQQLAAHHAGPNVSAQFAAAMKAHAADDTAGRVSGVSDEVNPRGKVPADKPAQTNDNKEAAAPMDADSSKKTCTKKLEEQWTKLSQPEYAIGMQMIASSDYQSLQQDFYSDSQLSAGLILPLLLFVWALLYGAVLGMPSWFLYFALTFVEAFLLMTAVDRRHKFETATDNLIAGGFMAKCKAKEDSPTSKAVADQIAAALTAAKIYRGTNLTIIPGTDTATGAQSQTPSSGSGSAQTNQDTSSTDDAE